MWVRLILDWVRALQPRWRPKGALLVVAEACFAVTDPPLKLVRRVVKPIRIGGAQLDFAWSIVLIARPRAAVRRRTAAIRGVSDSRLAPQVTNRVRCTLGLSPSG